MGKKGLLARVKRLSKPTGNVNWSQAIKAFILMVVAGLLATLLNFNNGLEAIIMVTLLATLIIDIAMPIKKVVILGLLGFIMTTLAFLSVSLSVHNLTAFIILSMLWAFFSISLYIFGNIEGAIGFSFFLTYFIAVLIVNPESTPIEWVSYTTLAYVVASTLLIPKLWVEKRKIRQLVSVGFNPQSTIQNVLANMHILSGISLNYDHYNFFKFGSYFKILRSYSELMTARLNSHDKKYFEKYLALTDEVSSKIGQNFQTMKGPLNDEVMDSYSNKIKMGAREVANEQALQISENILKILNYCNSLLKQNSKNNEHKTIKTRGKSFKEVINANFNLENMYMRHAVRFTLAMTIGLIFIYITRERSAIWITMGILIILKPDITSTMDNLIQRVGFNFIAIVLAIILGFSFPHYILVWFAVLMLFLFRAFYPSYMGLSVMAMTVFIVLVWPTGTVYDNAISRIVDITIGGIIAFICAYLILPNRVFINLPEQFTKTMSANVDYGLEMVKITQKNFDKPQAQTKLQNYMLQENNLEAGIKKLEDTFNDVNSDLSLYQNLLSLNIKLTADLTALAAVIEGSKTVSSVNILGDEIRDSLTRLREINLNWDGSKALDIDLTPINENSDDLAQLIEWIYSDIQLIFNGLEVAHETGLFKRYTNLT